jgi:hypothetical protein
MLLPHESLPIPRRRCPILLSMASCAKVWNLSWLFSSSPFPSCLFLILSRQAFFLSLLAHLSVLHLSSGGNLISFARRSIELDWTSKLSEMDGSLLRCGMLER